MLRQDVLKVGQWWHHRLQVVQLIGHKFDGRQGGKRSHHAGQRALRSVGVCWGEYRKVLLLLDVHQLRVTQRLLGDHRQVIKVHGLWLLGLVATVTILVFRLG